MALRDDDRFARPGGNVLQTLSTHGKSSSNPYSSTTRLSSLGGNRSLGNFRNPITGSRTGSTGPALDDEPDWRDPNRVRPGGGGGIMQSLAAGGAHTSSSINRAVDPQGLNATAENTGSSIFTPEDAGGDILSPDDEKYTPIDESEFSGGQEDLVNQIGEQYQAILRGDDPLAAQNERMTLTALDRMQSQVDQQTAREAAELGIGPGDEMYNELLEKNRQTIMSQGSGVLSNLAAQNMARRDKILAQGATFAKGQQQFGLDYGKTMENINRYGFEAGIADTGRKQEWSEYIMSNPDLFSEAQIGEAKGSYFSNLGIDISTLPSDPSQSQQAQTEIADALRIAHPDWSDDQIQAEATRLFGIFSPYTSGLYEKGYNEEMGITPGGDIAGGPSDVSGSDRPDLYNPLDFEAEIEPTEDMLNPPWESDTGMPGYDPYDPNVPFDEEFDLGGFGQFNFR